MKPPIALGVLEQSVAVFTQLSTFFTPLFSAHPKVIPINKVVASVVGRINVNHLDLAQVALLQDFQHFQVIALDVQVFGGVPVAAVLLYRAQRLGGGAGGFGYGLLLAHPGKLIPFIAFLHHIRAQQLLEHFKVDALFDAAILAPHLGNSRGEQSPNFFNILCCHIRRFHF